MPSRAPVHPTHLASKRRKVASTQTKFPFKRLKDKKDVTAYLVKNLATWMYDQKLRGSFNKNLVTDPVAELCQEALGITRSMVSKSLNHDLSNHGSLEQVSKTHCSTDTVKEEEEKTKVN